MLLFNASFVGSCQGSSLQKCVTRAKLWNSSTENPQPCVLSTAGERASAGSPLDFAHFCNDMWIQSCFVEDPSEWYFNKLSCGPELTSSYFLLKKVNKSYHGILFHGTVWYICLTWNIRATQGKLLYLHNNICICSSIFLFNCSICEWVLMSLELAERICHCQQLLQHTVLLCAW